MSSAISTPMPGGKIRFSHDAVARKYHVVMRDQMYYRAPFNHCDTLIRFNWTLFIADRFPYGFAFCVICSTKKWLKLVTVKNGNQQHAVLNIRYPQQNVCALTIELMCLAQWRQQLWCAALVTVSIISRKPIESVILDLCMTNLCRVTNGRKYKTHEVWFERITMSHNVSSISLLSRSETVPAKSGHHWQRLNKFVISYSMFRATFEWCALVVVHQFHIWSIGTVRKNAS